MVHYAHIWWGRASINELVRDLRAMNIPVSFENYLRRSFLHACVTHVPWCMSGSLTRGGGENVPSIPGACATRNFAYLVRGPRRHYGQPYSKHNGPVPVLLLYWLIESLNYPFAFTFRNNVKIGRVSVNLDNRAFDNCLSQTFADNYVPSVSNH